MINNYNRKDKKPTDTIKEIKLILKSLNIKIKESSIMHVSKNQFSIRIEIKGLYNLGSNGKGITPNFAKASAYAELMERLQSRMLVRNYFMGKCQDNVIPTNYNHNINDYSNYYNGSNTHHFLNFLLLKPDFTLQEEFYDAINNCSTKLPIKLISATCHSNGLCAGNTYYEAINQGVSEIFERYAYQSILKQEISLNNVIIDDTLPCINLINSIEKLGFNVDIKDCTLNNKLPVIGVLITDTNKNKYILSLASDLNINIAIQRCLTEICQGLNSKKALLNKMKEFNNAFDKMSIEQKKINWLKCYSSNNGLHSFKMLISTNNISYKDLTIFDNNSLTNEQVYEKLLLILKNNHYNLYIKDYSKVNFKTYRVYIPSISEIDKFEEIDLELWSNYNLIANIYYDIENDYNTDSLNKAETVLSKIKDSEKYKFIKMGEYFHSIEYISTKYNYISFEFFYILISIKLNKLENISKIENPKLKLFIENVIRENPSNPINYILNKLSLVNPSCPNCKKCKLLNKCKYKNWQKINNKLIQFGI